MTTKITLVLSIMLSAVVLGQENETVKVPEEVERFVKDLSIPIALESADLNGDGRKDYILVLERANPEMDDDGFPINQRPLLILLRGQDGKLTEAKRNETIVSCSECGGSQGDPFQGFDVGRTLLRSSTPAAAECVGLRTGSSIILRRIRPGVWFAAR